MQGSFALGPGAWGIRAGTLTRWRRSVAPRAWVWSVRVPAARSRLWVIAASIAQAVFAAKTPEGMWASGPSIRSANTDSMIACWRCVMSASVTGSGVVGEKRVVSPHREQLVGVVAVAYPPDDEPGGDLVRRAGERGVVDFGDLGVGDQLAGVGVEDGAG